MIELITATKDSHNFTLLLKCLKSGIHTYSITFNALRAKYEPFLGEDFEQAFIKEVRNDK